jgi:hypothetical protein
MLGGRLALAGTLAAVTVGATGCFTTEYEAPSHFTVTSAGVAKVVSGAINDTVLSPGLKGSPSVRCSPASCVISYTVKGRAQFNPDVELLNPTRQIWRALLEDPRFQHATIHADVAKGDGIEPLFTLDCQRAQVQRLDWNRVQGATLRRDCTFKAAGAGGSAHVF